MELNSRKLPNVIRLGCVGVALFVLVMVSTQAIAWGGHQPRGRTLAFRFIGTGTLVALDWAKWPAVLKETLPSGADCYMVPMYDVSGSIRRGTGVSCLSDVKMTGSPITALNTVYFRMPGGVIVSQGRVTAQPVVEPRDDGGVYGGMTHLIGALPAKDNIVKTTRGFKRWKGRVRCSGFVDLPSTGSGGIRMDNIYLIELSKKRKRIASGRVSTPVVRRP